MSNQPFNLTDTTDILAAIPPILGFSPEASIIVMVLHDVDGRTELRNALRFDINPEAAASLTTVAKPAFDHVSEAILVAVCGDWIARRAVDTLDIVRDALTELDIKIVARLITRNLDQPGQWTDLDTGARGPVTPFRDTSFAADMVLRGRSIVANRDQIVAEFTPTTNPAPLLTVEPIDFLVDTCETVAAIITGAAHAGTYPDLATRVGLLVTEDTHVRDALLLLSADHAAPAGALWTHLANRLTGAARLETLTLAAACFYLASDTVRAGIALDVAATDANAAHLDYPRLADMLQSMLQGGASPTQLRELLAALAARTED